MKQELRISDPPRTTLVIVLQVASRRTKNHLVIAPLEWCISNFIYVCCRVVLVALSVERMTWLYVLVLQL